MRSWKKRILEEIYETCVKKEFLKHEKTEYNISALEKTLLQNTTHKNISTLIIKQAGIKSIPANVLTWYYIMICHYITL